MSFRHLRTMVLTGFGIVAVLGFFIVSGINFQQGTISIAGPASLAEASSILKIEDVRIVSEKSANENIQLQGRVDGFGVAIEAINKDTKPAQLEVDRWEYRMEGNGFAFDLGSEDVAAKN